MQRVLFSSLVFSVVLLISPEVQAQPTLEFDYDPNTLVVTAIALSSPLTFTASTDYSYSGIQVRIFDVYPTVPGTVHASSMGGTFQLASNASSFSYISVYLADQGGSPTMGDMSIWSSGSYSFTTGQTLALSGQSAITLHASYPDTPLLAPTSGQYAIYLASQWDGSLLTNPINVNVAALAIPESSTYAAIFGLTALGFAAYFRRHKPAG